MTEWTPPDSYYNLHLRNGLKWAVEWASGERLSARLTMISTAQQTGRTSVPSFETVMVVEGGTLQIDVSEVLALEESTAEQRERWMQFRKVRKSEGTWDDE